MRCYACQQINTETARFCVECGASLAAGTWGQPAVVETQYAPAPYAPPPQLPSRMTAVAATALGAARPLNPVDPIMVGQGPAYAPYGYVPAQAPGPMAGPSLINNVTVTQAAPAPPPQPAPSVQVPLVVTAARRASSLAVFLGALFFLASGLAMGAFWVAAAQSSESMAAALAALITVILLLIDFVVLDRFARH